MPDGDDLERAGPRVGRFSEWGFLSGYQPATDDEAQILRRRRRRQARWMVLWMLVLCAGILVAAALGWTP
jgi:hypothetical protein